MSFIEQNQVAVQQLFSAVVADTLDRLRQPGRIVNERVGHVSGPPWLFGRVKTVRFESVESPPQAPYRTLLDAIDSAGPGEVLVMAADGVNASGLFGGLLANACRAAGVAGTVVDGAVRDVAELSRMRFPTFATGRSPADSYGRQEAVAYDVTLTVGGVAVGPRDWIIADVDGVVVVPEEAADDVVRAALRKIADEAEMRHALRDGMSLREAFATYGVL